MDLKMAIKQFRLLSVKLFEFSKRLPDKASIFTAELEAIVTDLRYIKITDKNNTFIVLVTINMCCRPCCPSGIIPLFKLL